MKEGDKLIHIHEDKTEEEVTLQKAVDVFEGEVGNRYSVSSLFYKLDNSKIFLASIDGKYWKRDNLKKP